MTAAAIKEYLPCPFNRTEAKIVQLMANGMQAKDTAAVLGIALHTVNNATQTAKTKARATSRANLVAISLRHGWVD